MRRRSATGTRMRMPSQTIRECGIQNRRPQIDGFALLTSYSIMVAVATRIFSFRKVVVTADPRANNSNMLMVHREATATPLFALL